MTDLPLHPRLVLSYQTAEPTHSPRWPAAIMAGALLPAAIAPFVPFTYEVTPLDVFVEFAGARRLSVFPDLALLLLLAGPFFLGPLLWAWQLRRVIRPTVTPAECRIATAFGIISSLGTVAFFGYGLAEAASGDAPDIEELLMAGAGPAVIVIGLIAWIASRRHRARPFSLAWIALSFAYLGNAVLCLIAFYGDSDIGWPMTLLSSLALTAQLVTHAAAALLNRG